MPEFTEALGLGIEPKDQWPARITVDAGKKPIDFLAPDGVDNKHRHDIVLDYLKTRIEASELKMGQFYDRWRVNEIKTQAYISLPDWEQELKKLNEAGRPPIATRIIVPHTFATQQTIVTFLLHTFTGRKPLFQVSSYKDETMNSAQMMEMKLQYDADHTKLIRQMWQFFQDTQQYGLGIFRCMWRKDLEKRTRRQRQVQLTQGGIPIIQTVPIREEVTTYEGNMVKAQDPFMFYPDPNVEMTDVNSKGEFVFWRSFEGKHTMLNDERMGYFKFVQDIPTTLPRNLNGITISARSNLSKGDPHAGLREGGKSRGMRDYMQVDQGTVDIIPRELGLGESTNVEKWIFTFGNKAQIIQAEPFDTDHGMHPVAISEPYSMGYGFGQPGLGDYFAPLQDLISWFVNSHLDNVRKSLNDMFIVDPSMVEMQDLKNPEPGKLIRLKRASFGMDVRQAVQQLDVNDVTSQHVADAQDIIRLGQLLSGVNDNILGMQDEGGRKTATEVRTSNQASSSRLAAQARIISAQGVVDLTKMMSLNNQQFLSQEFYMQVVGREGARKPLRLSPDQITGDFYYPVNDGTLPTDRVALVDIWKEIFLALMQDPGLRSQYNMPRIFEHIAELGGAKNIEEFRMQVIPDAQAGAQAQAGNIVPISQAPRRSAQSPLTNARPQNRVAQALGAA